MLRRPPNSNCRVMKRFGTGAIRMLPVPRKVLTQPSPEVKLENRPFVAFSNLY